MEGFTFTSEEWKTVRAAPWIVGNAVIDADGGSPFSVLREIGAVDRQLDHADRTSDHRSLVKTVAHELKDAQTSAPLVEPTQLEDWKAQLERVLEIVDAKAPDADNRDFREWLYDIAVDTAEAARDHWRVKGPHVSEEEETLLVDLAAMLDVE